MIAPCHDEGGVTLYLGDCVEVMATLPEMSIDAIVTDPPYGLEFMGKKWDKLGAGFSLPGIGDRELPWQSGRGTNESRCSICGLLIGHGGSPCTCSTPSPVRDLSRWHMMQEWHERWAREALRVLKPGGHLMAFGGTRTSHRLVNGIEDAGFEIRDTLSWLYGSGFPKSHSQLKPAWEPITLARKPLVGTVAANVTEYGTGALNIDAARIDYQSEDDQAAATPQGRATSTRHAGAEPDAGRSLDRDEFHRGEPDGRWPANVVLDEEAAALLDAQAGTLGNAYRPNREVGQKNKHIPFFGRIDQLSDTYADEGGPSRFFYTAKASRNERELGLRGHLPCTTCGALHSKTHARDDGEPVKCRRNDHPTVKPVSLMDWLVSLVLPLGGVILDPFVGSGTTGVATLIRGGEFIGIDQDQGYLDIARWRIAGRDGLEEPPPPPPPPPPEGQQAFALE